MRLIFSLHNVKGKTLANLYFLPIWHNGIPYPAIPQRYLLPTQDTGPNIAMLLAKDLYLLVVPTINHNNYQ